MRDEMFKHAPNAYQIGGTHYKTDYEHWDLALNVNMGYLEGCATKYVARHKKKGGPEDLKKALHYTNKLIENAPRLAPSRRVNRRWVNHECIHFFEANDLSGQECAVIMGLSTWENMTDLEAARDGILSLIELEESKQPELELKPSISRLDSAVVDDELRGHIPAPATDSNKHADRGGAVESKPEGITGALGASPPRAG